MQDSLIAHLCAEEGYTVEALSVIRFLDNCESSPWFYRNHELVAYMAVLCDGGRPLDSAAVLQQAREDFGNDVSVMWP